MATFTFFHEFKRYVLDPSAITTGGPIDHNGSTFAVALSNTAPVVATDTVLANITQITAQFGYVAGGQDLNNPSLTETGAGTGVWKFTADNEVFTASGGSFGPFRYVVLYVNSTTNPADILVGYADIGSAITVPDGQTFEVDASANGWFVA